ncbi:MAG: iron ABC transporter permease, partial [Acidobacteria bacterium]|nr:iron ABC transporter permease [Acidobacteriota bacterium]
MDEVAVSLPTSSRVTTVSLLAVVGVVAVSLVSLAVGPFQLSLGAILGDIGSHLGLGGAALDDLSSTVLWQLRAPRIVLALIVGTMLAVAGGTYQGVFRNPLADPYLLGVAAGAGLGATVAIVGIGDGLSTPSWTPLLAFVGALSAVAVTWMLGGRGSSATLVLAGVAVSSLLTSAQTFVQQSSHSSIARVYIWLLGSLGGASWHNVLVTLPYVVVCCAVCLLAGRALDVLSVGDVESRALGLSVTRVRLLLVVAASLGTAAVVSAVGLVGFVGI